MAVAGGGVPAQRVHIYARQLRRTGLAHNVDSMVILTPAQAAEHFARGGGDCYIESVGTPSAELQARLEAMGLVDKHQATREWVAWALQDGE